MSALFIFSLSALIELDKQFVCVKVGNWFMKDAFCEELTLVNQNAIFIYFILFYTGVLGLRKWANTGHA